MVSYRQRAAEGVLELLLLLGRLDHGGLEAGIELAVLHQGDDLAYDHQQADGRPTSCVDSDGACGHALSGDREPHRGVSGVDRDHVQGQG